jgi:glycosyltransferase involved in cell wall biosynthesis
MKKVLFMLTSMNIGGVEKSLLSLLSILPKDQYDVTILLLEKKGGFSDQLPNWVKVEEANWFIEIKPIVMQPPQRTIFNFYKKKQYIKVISFLYVYFKSKYFGNRFSYYKQVLKSVPQHKETYDIAIAYQGPTDLIDFYISQKVTAKKKWSWVHFDVSKHFINHKLYTELYKSLDKVMVVSEEAKKQLINMLPSVKEKVSVFPNIVSLELIRKMAKERVELDPNFSGVKIVTVGRLSQEKGQDLAIQVLARLKKEGYNVKWYCIGDGNARHEYERFIAKYQLQNDFILLGSTSNPYPYIDQADLYVQTSRHEGYCLTLAEAKCLAKLIISTDFTGAKEQLINGFNGWVVNCQVEALYKKIKEMLDYPDKGEKLKANLIQSQKESNNQLKERKILLKGKII